jgi:uncharacterized protein with beta-barrel porin domain
LNANAGYRRGFGDTDPTTSFTLSGSSPFTVTGAAGDVNTVLAGVGLDIDISETLTLSGAYDMRYSSQSLAHGLELRLGGAF